MMHSLAQQYRPRTFEEVRGQEHAVKVLSGLVRRGQRRRDPLLHGSVGSGKTTLVRIYGAALNCDSPTPTGSPCGQCAWCADPTLHANYFVEYDVPGRGGTKASIQGFLDRQLSTAMPAGKVKVIFFDEAHALENEAADAMLKRIEERDQSTVFCFATTEIERLRPALRSRLFQLEVRPLAPDVAIDWLREIAHKAEIAIDDDALNLLAGIRNGYPRDLLTGLELVHDPDECCVTLERVLDVFNLQHTTILPSYFLALAEGDIDEQTELMHSWRQGTAEKVRWTTAFMTSLYYKEICGLSLVVEPAVEVIGPDVRAAIVSGMCSRFGVGEPRQLKRYWLQMLAFWRLPDMELDEAALQLRLVLFHHLINEELPAGKVHRDYASALGKLALRPSAIVGSKGFGDRPPVQAEGQPPPPRDIAGFLRFEDVRRIINSASFLVQEYGVMINFAAEISPARFGILGEKAGRSFIDRFCGEFVDAFGESEERPLNYLRVIEGDDLAAGYAVRGFLAAHVPVLGRASGNLQEAPQDAVERWCREWVARNNAGLCDGLSWRVCSGNDKSGAFHRAETLRLCAGLDEDWRDWDPVSRSWRPLHKLLGLPRSGLRRARPVSEPLLEVSAHLEDDAIDGACANKMEPLSAFDDRAWSHLSETWELDEYRDRRQARKSRDADIRRIRAAHTDRPDEMSRAIDNLVGSWPDTPQQRGRKWIGWWAKQGA